MRRLLPAILVLSVVACGPSQKTPVKPGTPTGGSVSIAKANLPYSILRARGGTEVDEATFLAELKAAQAVCIGENHKNPHHHWAQLDLFDKLSKHNKANGRDTALGMEMFQRTFQGVMDDYVAGRIDQAAMLSRTGYKDRWGFDWGFYGPTIEVAIARGAVVLALNTERELTKRVARNGLSKLTDAERAKLPELDLEDPTHRAWWNNIMGGMSHPTPEKKDAPKDPHAKDPHAAPKDPHADPHAVAKDPHAKDPHAAPKDPHAAPKDPHAAPKDPNAKDPHGAPHPMPKRARPDTRAEWIYTAQVLWDETMADGAVKWLREGANRQVIIIAGNGHCHDSAIVGRMKRRGITRTVSVRPVIDSGDGELASHLASPENDYLFVMTPEGQPADAAR